MVAVLTLVVSGRVVYCVPEARTEGTKRKQENFVSR